MQCEDEMKNFSPYFSAKTKCIFIVKKCYSQLVQRNLELLPGDQGYDPNFAHESQYVRDCDPVSFLGIAASEAELPIARELFANVLNEIFETGHVTGVLSPPVSIQLTSALSGNIYNHMTALICYFAIDNRYVDAIKTKYKKFFMCEGGAPLKLEEFKRDAFNKIFTKELEERLDVV